MVMCVLSESEKLALAHTYGELSIAVPVSRELHFINLCNHKEKPLVASRGILQNFNNLLGEGAFIEYKSMNCNWRLKSYDILLHYTLILR